MAKRIVTIVLVSAVVSLGVVMTSAADDDPTAGPGAVALDDEECTQAQCPLHHWMEKHMQPPVEAGDTRALAKALKQTAGFAPDPSWNQGTKSWRQISLDGATKAEAGDMAGARASCKSCHQAWRKQYKAQFRSRAVP